jgi:hypothetical protein
MQSEELVRQGGDPTGDRDPVGVLEATIPTIRRLCDPVPHDVLHSSPDGGGKSAVRVIGDLFDIELSYAFRWRRALSGGRPVAPGDDVPPGSVGLPGWHFWQVFGAWQVLRASNLLLLRHAEAADDPSAGVFGGTIRELARHDLSHIAQLQRAL